MLEARHLVKRFFGTAVVSDVSFEVRAGEVVGYLMLIAIMVGLGAGMMAVDRASRRPATTLDFDEPTPLSTQRLDLAS